MANEVITKRRVTMTNVVSVPVSDEFPDGYAKHQAVDYVRPDFLDAYVAAARANWQNVEVSDEPDAGPGGYHGATAVPEGIDHPLAGQVFAATEEV